jgi:hypothetical protein
MHIADQVANAVNSPFLDPHKSFRLVTTSVRIAAWQAAGADMDTIIATVSAVMKLRKEGGQVTTWAYFDEPIRRAIADLKAMESFDAEQRTGPAAQRAKRNRAAEAVLSELDGMAVAR